MWITTSSSDQLASPSWSSSGSVACSRVLLVDCLRCALVFSSHTLQIFFMNKVKQLCLFMKKTWRMCKKKMFNASRQSTWSTLVEPQSRKRIKIVKRVGQMTTSTFTCFSCFFCSGMHFSYYSSFQFLSSSYFGDGFGCFFSFPPVMRDLVQLSL